MNNLLQLINDPFSTPDNLYQSYKPGDFNEFIQFTNLCNSDNTFDFAFFTIISSLTRDLKNYIEWKNREHINNKPALDIWFGNCFPVVNCFEDLVLISCIEVEYDVHEEYKVDDIVQNYVPL